MSHAHRPPPGPTRPSPADASHVAASLAQAAASLLVEARLRGQPLDEAQALERAYALYARALALIEQVSGPGVPLAAQPLTQPLAQPPPPVPSLPAPGPGPTSGPPPLPHGSTSFSPQPPPAMPSHPAQAPLPAHPGPPQPMPSGPGGPPPMPAQPLPSRGMPSMAPGSASSSMAGDLQLLMLRDPSSLTGRTVAGRYRLEQLLADGGPAVLFRAVVERTGQDVALRVLKAGLGPRHTQRWARAQQQAREAQRLTHPAFVKPDELGEASGLVYVVTELLSGQSLSKLLGEQQSLSVQQALDVAWRLGDAMRSAHEQGVVHGCLEPDRLVIQTDPGSPGGYRLRVLDAGLSELLGPGLPGSGGAATALPWYMAPEQLMGRETDEKSDVYAAGAVLFECLAGSPPFADSESLGQFLARKQGEEVPPPSSLRPGVPPHVDWAVLHALAPSREKRTPSMTALLQSIAPPKR